MLEIDLEGGHVIRRLTLLTTIGVAAVALVWALSAPAAATKKLSGTVGPSSTITLKFGGRTARTLKAGTYRITVRDRSAGFHNFELTGPGVNKVITGLAFTGTRTTSVRLRRGTYTYFCRPHKNVGMKKTFRVT